MLGKREGVLDLVNFAVVKSFSKLTKSNNKRQRIEKKEKEKEIKHALMEKLLTPNCSNFPCIGAFLYLCQCVVEVDFVSRFTFYKNRPGSWEGANPSGSDSEVGWIILKCKKEF